MIDKLAYFVALAREQSFRRAAEACGVAQPTLSAAIKQLEAELGVLLVRRSSRFLGLTPEGEKVLEWGRRMVGDAGLLRQELRAMRTGLSGHVRLAVVPTALAMVPRLTGPCLARHPALQFTILSCPSTRVLQMLDELEVDAGITYLDNEALGRVRAVPLYTERYRLVVRRDSPVAGRGSVGWADLAGLSLCLLTPDMQNRRIMDRLMRGAGVEPRAVLESNSQITLLAHVLTGRFATILPESLAEALAGGPDLVRIPILAPEATYQIGLVVPLRDPVPVLAAALLSEARLLSLP
ncbi:MAG: LysR family transcriptional regulator [Janthinobacterium lividum]